MAKATTTNRRTPDLKDESREGSRLAMVMLTQLDLSPSLCAKCGVDAPAGQDNIVMRYLDTCRQRGGRNAEVSFCALLSDWVATSAMGAGPTRIPWYERTLKIRMPRFGASRASMDGVRHRAAG